jgi:hypothetical protein
MTTPTTNTATAKLRDTLANYGTEAYHVNPLYRWMRYDVLVVSLHRTLNRNTQRWVRGVKATSLSEACRIAEARYPDLGVTPTIASMAWPQWPQPKEPGASRRLAAEERK